MWWDLFLPEFQNNQARGMSIARGDPVAPTLTSRNLDSPCFLDAIRSGIQARRATDVEQIRMAMGSEHGDCFRDRAMRAAGLGWISAPMPLRKLTLLPRAPIGAPSMSNMGAMAQNPPNRRLSGLWAKLDDSDGGRRYSGRLGCETGALYRTPAPSERPGSIGATIRLTPCLKAHHITGEIARRALRKPPMWKGANPCSGALWRIPSGPPAHRPIGNRVTEFTKFAIGRLFGRPS